MQRTLLVFDRLLLMGVLLAAVPGCTSDDSRASADSGENADVRASDAHDVVGPDQYPSWLLWAKGLGGRVNHLAALPDGSFMITGCFTQDDFFDEAARDDNVTYSSSATMFVARYDLKGELSWLKEAESEDGVCGGSIAVLPDGSSAVEGSFGGTAIFGKGEAGQTELTGPASVFSDFPKTATFVSRYDARGGLQWARFLTKGEPPGGVWPQDVAILPDRSAVVVGHFAGTAVFGEGEPNQTELTAERDATDLHGAGYSVFLAKYGPEGDFEWAKQAGGLQHDEGWGISALEDGSFVVTGRFTGVATFGEGEAGEIVLEAPGSRSVGGTANEPFVDYNTDIFVARYRSDGTVVWAKSAGSDVIRDNASPYFDVGRDIAASPDGSILVTGSFGDVASFGKGGANEIELRAQRRDGEEGHEFVDIFVAKYDPEGMVQWATSAGSPSDPIQLVGDMGYGVGVAADGSCFVTGSITGEPTFGGRHSDGAEIEGVFVAKYTADGSIDEAVTFGGQGSLDVGYAVAPLSDGSALVMGSYGGPFMVDGKTVLETQLSEKTHDYVRKKFIIKLRL